MTINKKLMNCNHTAKKRGKADIKFIVVHYVGALGDAKANAEYYGSGNVGASADFFVGFAGDIWQANDYWNYYSWHCGGGYQSSWRQNGGGRFYQICTNSNSVGIEMCVRKKNKGHLDATDTDWYFEDATVKATAELVRFLMKELDVDIDHVIRHYDVNSKICPNPFVVDHQKWLAFLELVKSGKYEEPKWYRVRLSWGNEKSQVGAYEKLENAKKSCPAGYTVYDHSGKAVYKNAAKGTQAKSLNGMSEAEKIKFMAPLYQDVAKKTGMLASVGLAQFCLESGYGTTDLAQNANNLHGMKCSLSGNTWSGSSWDGVSSYRKKTAEQDKAGNEYFVNADFRKYPCMEDSIADRAAYYLGAMNGSKRRYDGIENLKTAEEQVKAIKAGGYATDVKYVSKLMNIIDRFNLTQYDDHEKAPKEKETAPASNPEDIYVVRKSLKDVKSQLGAYHVLNNAKNKASENYGYKVFDLTTGKAVFEPTWTKAQLYIAAAKRMDEIMRQDIKDGLKWVYINNKPRANTFNEARIQGKRYTNCCTGALWAAQEADLVPLKAVQWFGDHQNIVFINGNSGKKEAEKYFEFIKVGNKTVKQCVKDGTVKPGDILMYKDLTHTNAYLGDNVSFDTGHATCSAKGENAPFKCWVAPLTYLDFVVMWIARLRENVKYRVRIGIFQDPSNIKRNDAKLEKAEMCPYHKQTANGTAIYSGAFDQSSKAEKRLKEIKALGYNGAVIEVS